MKIGFTGSRVGMTTAQRDAFASRITAPEEFHHGCCVGADEDAARMVFGTGCPRVVGHAPDNARYVSEVALGCNTENHDPLPYLGRNQRIVDATDVLVACPMGPEVLRSGTWSTVRYARKQRKRIVIIWPDGTVTTGGT
ncbi:hypothetical protein [Gemmata sp.]|uniref:hypothetical protein n=1 Tax=Gemmata sp. TaxID=1914242 RepID=UPI003F6EA051